MKLLIVKKQLFSGGEDKILPAVHALEYLVLEFHDPVVATLFLAGNARPPRKIPNLPGPATEAASLHFQRPLGERTE
jgi:hypothetical protein